MTVHLSPGSSGGRWLRQCLRRANGAPRSAFGSAVQVTSQNALICRFQISSVPFPTDAASSTHSFHTAPQTRSQAFFKDSAAALATVPASPQVSTTKWFGTLPIRGGRPARIPETHLKSRSLSTKGCVISPLACCAPSMAWAERKASKYELPQRSRMRRD